MTEQVWLSYREAAARTKRSIRSINRWRRNGYIVMEWATRDGQRVRVVEETALLACFRERLKSDPAHQYRLRKLREIADQTVE